jgi:hypothetical protein
MRIAIVSEFRPAYTVAIEACYSRALVALGHEIVEVQTFPRLAARGGVGWILGTWPARVRQSDVNAAIDRIRPDAIVIVKGVGILGATVGGWKRAGARVVNLFPDNPFDAMGATPFGSTLLDQLRVCDRVFVHDRFAAGQLRQLSVRAEFIAFARDPALHDRSMVDQPVSNHPKIVFVGNPDPERVAYLRAIADLGLGLWGNWHWAQLRRGDPLADCVKGDELMGQRMTACLGAAQLSINILRRSQKTGHNMRTFESPASGTCTVSERSNAVLELMEDGVEVSTFASPRELRDVCLRLLADAGMRVAIGEAGWRRVEDETYERRAVQLLEAIAT